MNIENEVKKAQHGDRRAFVNIIREVENDLYGMAYSILRNEQDSADALQEAILKAYKSLGTLRDESLFKTWMYRIIINESNKLAKKRSRSVAVSEFSHQVGVSGEYENIELYEAVDQLEDPMRLVIILKYFYDLNIKEISKTLGISESLVKTRLYRARKSLLRMLSNSGERGTPIHGRY
ncbi:sigma-70 family RNA polymerase sigma factor [Paenibacillus kribbensis]|uniref:sigma-70 family RNA polymerase sigma factor n=1 Tax=Paenibacillus kribbensis TaxID=172713 RepID=UPI00083829B2|nr:sigma-70 family RNA polymerase sigma factor [Paenibacillus kribbensis]